MDAARKLGGQHPHQLLGRGNFKPTGPWESRKEGRPKAMLCSPLHFGMDSSMQEHQLQNEVLAEAVGRLPAWEPSRHRAQFGQIGPIALRPMTFLTTPLLIWKETFILATWSIAQSIFELRGFAVIQLTFDPT